MDDKRKIELAITKSVNKDNEDMLKSRAFTSGAQNLSNAQKAVAKHHEKKSDNAEMETS
jgi:hypothetical protein